MLHSQAKIAGVSDVSVGYGSPQVLRLMQSLADQYGRQVTLMEPDQTDKKPLRVLPPGCVLQRLATSTHPHTLLGRREYVRAASRHINALRPEMLVLFGTYTLPVLTQLHYRPRWTVYYCYETVPMYGALDVTVNQCFARDIDVVVFPEENRARLDGQRCQLAGLPTALLYNVSNDRHFRPSPVAERTWKLLYTGTLDRAQTLADYFLQPQLAEVPIDLFGSVAGHDGEALKAQLTTLLGAVRYRGYVPAATLKQVRARCAYSVIMWAPTNENQLYAAPNKFFDAIADGIPPIVAPHPQCALIVKRYQCGILMENWSFEAFVKAIRRAKTIFGTAEYERMVGGCGRAVQLELNWPAQYEKLKRLLPPTLEASNLRRPSRAA